MVTLRQVDVKAIKRVVIFRYDAETQMISFRHYEICTKAVGLSKGVKSLMKVRVPDLSAFSDIKDFVVKYVWPHSSLCVYECHAEGTGMRAMARTRGQTHRLRSRGAQNGVCNRALWCCPVRVVSCPVGRLTTPELGPRIDMKLLKIEDGLHTGAVLYHSLGLTSMCTFVGTAHQAKCTRHQRRLPRCSAALKRRSD